MYGVSGVAFVCGGLAMLFWFLWRTFHQFRPVRVVTKFVLGTGEKAEYLIGVSSRPPHTDLEPTLYPVSADRFASLTEGDLWEPQYSDTVADPELVLN